MCMKPKHSVLVIGAVCLPLVLATAQSPQQETQGRSGQKVGEITYEDPEMLDLRKEQLKMALELERARMEMEQAEARREVELARHFGYSYFTTGTGTDPAFLANLPVPRGYRLGPGDEVVVSLWGQTQMQERYVIDRRGMIFVPEIGPLQVTGKSVEEAEAYLKNEFAKVYSTLKSTKDRTYMDVSVGTLQSINVQIVGEVFAPGMYTIHPFSTVVTALIQAGGVDITGSLRAVQVRRNGEVAMKVDLYRLMLEGEETGDFRLQEGDIIFVPVRKSTVEISGEVYHPGIYEALPGESVEQVISYAGGVKPTAGSTVQLRRIKQRASRESDDEAITVTYLNMTSLNPHEVLDGDDIWVRSIMEVSRQVYVSGQVKRPGAYAYTDSLRLLDLLQMAGGVHDEDYLKSVNLDKIDIIRRDLLSDYSEVITLNLAEVIKGNPEHNILLHNHDQVTVYPDLNYLPAKTVTITGEVLLPGVYPIQHDFETLGSVIERAGGYTSRAFEEGIVLLRGGSRVVVEGLDNTVADGDSITVPEKTDVVQVTGAVYNPGLISYKKGRSLGQYVSKAGGVTPEANRKNIMVIYADGSIKHRRFYINPRLRPGATIRVNTLPVQTPAQVLLTFLTDISNTFAQLATSYLLITQIGDLVKR